MSPISRARWFIMLAKAASEPAMFSAMVIAASLPDCTIRPRTRSDILMRLLTCANIEEPPPPAPPRRQASSVTVNSVSMDRRPDFSASNTMSVVISLAMLAGAKGSSAAFSNSTEPDSASIRIAWGAAVWKVCARTGWASASAQAAARRVQRGVRIVISRAGRSSAAGA